MNGTFYYLNNLINSPAPLTTTIHDRNWSDVLNKKSNKLRRNKLQILVSVYANKYFLYVSLYDFIYTFRYIKNYTSLIKNSITETHLVDAETQ